MELFLMKISCKLVFFIKFKMPSSDKKLNLNPRVDTLDYLFSFNPSVIANNPLFLILLLPRSTNSNVVLTLNVVPNSLAPSNPIRLKKRFNFLSVEFFLNAKAMLLPPETPTLLPDKSKNSKVVFDSKKALKTLAPSLFKLFLLKFKTFNLIYF